jgi:hypothetical protein
MFLSVQRKSNNKKGAEKEEEEKTVALKCFVSFRIIIV